MPAPARNRFFLAALAMTLAGFLLMIGFENIGAEVRSSQLQLQFAWTARAVDEILAAWGEAGRERVIRGLHADTLFLIGYTLLLTQWLRAWRQPRWLAWGVWLAGGLDVLENTFLFGFIQGGIDVAFAPLVSVMSTLKFGLIGAAVVYLGTAFRASK